MANLSNIASTVSNVASQVQKGGMTQSQINSAISALKGAQSQISSGLASGSIRSGVDYKELDRPTQMAAAASQMLAEQTKTPPVITPEAIKTPTPTIPVFNQLGRDYQGVLNGLTQAGAQGTLAQMVDQGSQKQVDLYKQMQELVGTPPSTAEAYQQAQRESGILEKQQRVNDLSAQLNTITAQAQANQLAVTGQGRGIPEAIIGGQQAQIAKEAAIQALPVSASLQAAQGNLEMAQQNLNTLFQIKSQDATNQYNYKRDLVKGLYEIADKQEQRKLDLAVKMEERKYNEEQKNIDDIRAISMAAVKNGAPAASIQRISGAKTPEQALMAAANYMISPMEKLQLEKLRTDIAESKAKLTATSSESPTQAKIDGAISIKNLISDLNSMNGKSGAVGASFQKLVTWGNLIPGTDASNYKATFDQLRDTLAAENLSKLKGPMSDKDIVFVRNIATKLSTDLSEEEFDKELSRLNVKMNEVLEKNGVNPTEINSYSGLSNDQLLNLATQQISNQSFFNK